MDPSSEISAYEAKKLAEVNLLKESGIVGFGLGKGKGYYGPVELVNVYVEDVKTSLSIPKTIAGYQTNTIITGKLNALVISRTMKVRPVLGGISVGHYAITAGTIGAIVTIGGKRYILSNNHVLANCNKAKIGDAIYQPGRYDGGTSDDTAAPLSKFIFLNFSGENNLVDCALAQLTVDSLAEILDIGVVKGVESAQVGMTVIKSGRTSGLTEATITDVNATMKVGYGEGLDAIFEDQVVTTKLGDPGDSGSLVLNKANNNAVSLLFAGSDTITLLNKIENVQKALGFTFPGGQVTPPPSPAQSSIPLIFGIGLAGAVIYSLVKRKK